MGQCIQISFTFFFVMEYESVARKNLSESRYNAFFIHVCFTCVLGDLSFLSRFFWGTIMDGLFWRTLIDVEFVLFSFTVAYYSYILVVMIRSPKPVFRSPFFVIFTVTVEFYNEPWNINEVCNPC